MKHTEYWDKVMTHGSGSVSVEELATLDWIKEMAEVKSDDQIMLQYERGLLFSNEVEAIILVQQRNAAEKGN
jgi:hypothetical protein